MPLPFSRFFKKIIKNGKICSLIERGVFMEKELITDILVVGYGYAGAIAAITAHDMGAKVMIIEKMPHFGGCSILSGGGILYVKDPEGAFKYFNEMCGGRTSPEIIKAQVEMMADTENYLRALCQVDNARCEVWHRPAIYPYPGRDSLNSATIAEVPGFEGFPWLISKERGANFMKVLVDNVDKRKIPILTSTAAKEITTTPSGKVTGIRAINNGKEITIKTKRAVILACGGFEHNEWLKLQFLEGKPYYSMAPLGNTGDGVLMSMKVGASLWHMWHVHGGYGFKYPEYPLAFRHHIPGSRDPYQRRPFYFKMRWIVVDRHGKRFMNEFPPAPQDTGHRPLSYFDPDLPGYPRIPCYLIFDETARNEGPIAKPMGLKEVAYQWSKDNQQEIEKEWIIKGNTIEDLARRIKMEPKNLASTVEKWNKCVQMGEDIEFGRPAGTLFAPIQDPPYYAMEAWPIITNTQGGPEHNARQQVVDPSGKPIPRLYAIGELGSMFGHLYELAGNIGECISSGRIAGRYASEEKLLK